MTSKKHRQAIADSLSSALEPPKSRRPSPALNDILSQYAPPTGSTLSTQSTESTQSAPVAPVRDFQKVANSITRTALPGGVFKGKCKQLYDFLYSKTRGAIVPSRSVRLTRREIMKGSDIGSTKTLFLNLRHLRAGGLVTWDERVGPHGGNVYTVYLPEEAAGTQSTNSTQSTDSASSPKVDRVLVVESTESTHSLNGDVKELGETSKTLLKTKEQNTDDEAAPLARALSTVERELTGKNSDPAKWSELAEVLIAELRIAAGRTTVSSVPAFLAAHLRRRLWKTDKARLDASGGPVEARERASGAAEEHKVDATGCPDCFGTNMRYVNPQTFEGGVVRCKHENLSKTDPLPAD